jgi:hypothetical protein
VQQDLLALRDQSHVAPDWRLHPDEIEPAIAKALELIRSLREDPYQGDVLQGRASAPGLREARRLKLDPRTPAPRDRRGRPRPRLRLVWRNLPGDEAVEIVRVAAADHRQGSRPYRRKAMARDRDRPKGART